MGAAGAPIQCAYARALNQAPNAEMQQAARRKPLSALRLIGPIQSIRKRLLTHHGFDDPFERVRPVEIDDIHGIAFRDAALLQRDGIPDDAHDPFIGGALLRVGHGPIVALTVAYSA